MKSSRVLLIILVITAISLFAEGTQEKGQSAMAVFVPGVAAGSPTYEQMVKGAEKAAFENDHDIKILEGGFNQAEWESKVTALAASGEYEYIITSNTSMPAICQSVNEKIPGPKYICADGYLDGNKSISGAFYNQREQAYLAGYAAGLTTRAADATATQAGAVIAQHYPVMDEIILPAYEEGFKAVVPAGSVEVRVVGNWYDAGKGADLAQTLYEKGIQVILPISGGAGQGILKAAIDSSRYVVWFDSNNFAAAPSAVTACAVLNQEKLVYEMVTAAVQGTLSFGSSHIKTLAEGFINLEISSSLPEIWTKDNTEKMNAVISSLADGTLNLPISYEF